MSETIIKTEGVVVRQQKNTILKNVNLEIESGEFVYIIGKVGSGKSSFLKTLYAELPLEYGKAEVAGFQLNKIKKSNIPLLRRKCGIVFQDFKLLTDRTVNDNLEFVLKATGWNNKKAIRERIETVLEKVEMMDKRDKMPHQLSGGEQQRIVLARALLNAPSLILADEPTGNIDPETSYHLIQLLKDICESGKTIIIATHQYDLIERFPGRVLRCENGELFEDPVRSVRLEKKKEILAEIVIDTEETMPLPEYPTNTVEEDSNVENTESETATMPDVDSPTSIEENDTYNPQTTEQPTPEPEDITISETQSEQPESEEIVPQDPELAFADDNLENVVPPEQEEKKESTPPVFGFELIE